jgi:hypothetical protein
LTPETIEVLDGALKPKRIEITRQSLQAELDSVLRRGFTTTHAGGFFFIPYLMELDLYEALGKLNAPKTTGIPNEKVALQLIWEPLFGYTKGIRAVTPWRDKPSRLRCPVGVTLYLLCVHRVSVPCRKYYRAKRGLSEAAGKTPGPSGVYSR